MTAQTVEPFPEAPRGAAWMNNALFKAVIILLLGLLIYSPAFHGVWLMDDDMEVTLNALPHDPHGLHKIWSGAVGEDYLPLKSTVQWLAWRVFGGDPTGYHLMTVGLHLLCALLFWRLLFRLGLRHSWVGALLFTVHPMMVDSVAWVAELKNTLSLAVLLAAMLAWLRFDEHRRARDYSWTLALFAAALLCKSSVIMWPVVILLHAWWKRGRIAWADLRVTLPFFALSLASGITTIWFQHERAIRREIYPVGGFASHFALAGLDLVFYLGKLIYPARLLPMYPRWRIDPPSAVEFLPWLFIGALFWWLWTNRGVSWARAALFGLGFFVINLAPVLGVMKMSLMRIAWVSDHLVYLPSLGIFGLAAAGLGALYDRLDFSRRGFALGLGWLGIAVLSVVSHSYAGVFSDMGTWCAYTIKYNPDAWLAHELYLIQLLAQNDPGDALVEARAAARLNPGKAETQRNLGVVLMATGKMKEAVAPLREAVRLDPLHKSTRITLARCLARQGDFAEALPEYLTLVRQDPNNAPLHNDTGVCLYELGRHADAIAQFRQAVAIDPKLESARDSLAAALAEQNAHAR